MNIDKRYVELLADAAPNNLLPRNKWWKRLSSLGFLIFAIGALLFLSGKILGIGISGAGFILIGFSAIKKRQEDRKLFKAFVEYYEKNNALPPWPEDEKANR